MIKVGGRSGDFHGCGLLRIFRKPLEVDFCEVQISVFGSTGTPFREAVILKDIDPKSSDALNIDGRGDGIAFWSGRSPLCKEGKVFLFGEFCLTRSDKGLGVERFPFKRSFLMIGDPGFDDLVVSFLQ